jgi:dTDP-6-deoxy-L-talose 4-dehydrogenase (NAD+)
MAHLSIAITGAGGFIGRHLLEALLSHNLDVTALTRDRKRLATFEGRIAIVEGDIMSPNPALLDQLASHDVLLHLAWDGLPNYRSLHHFESQLPAQYAFLRAVIGAGLGAVVVTGTCFEYGMQSGELSENMEAIPGNAYGFAKDALRKQLVFLQQTVPFDLTWARLFYMYGEGQAANSLYSQLSKAVALGEKRFNMSGGEQLRDFLHVRDVAHYLATLARLRSNAGVVNICAGAPRSVRGLVEGWLAQNDWRIELNLGHYPYPDYEPFAFWGDNRKLAALMKHAGEPVS